MGVTRFNEIKQYLLRQEGDSDVLKIYYKRGKGSYLPYSRTYQFGLAGKALNIDSGTSTTKTVYEISPFLQSAVLELDSLVSESKDTAFNKAQLLAEFNELEQVMLDRMHAMRDRIENI